MVALGEHHTVRGPDGFSLSLEKKHTQTHKIRVRKKTHTDTQNKGEKKTHTDTQNKGEKKGGLRADGMGAGD